MIRRIFLQLLLGMLRLSKVRFTKTSIKLKRTKIDKSKLVMLWYENEKGEIFIPPLDMLPDKKCLPDGFVYQRSQFPTVLSDNCLRIEDDRSVGVFWGEKGWSADLVLAMTNSGDYEFWQSILIAANSCERCTNTLAHKYGLEWGYPEYSKDWQACGTKCDFCKID